MFFQQMYDWMTSGVDITLSLRKQENQLTIIVVPRANNVKNAQQKLFIPMTVTGTPQMLDAEFATVISEPLKKATSLLFNVKIPEKQISGNKEAKETKEGKVKYEQLFKKGEELEKQKKYKEALVCFEEAKTCAQPSNMKSINDKINSMKAWACQGNLFDMINEGRQNSPETVSVVPAKTSPNPIPLFDLPGEQLHEDTSKDLIAAKTSEEQSEDYDFDNMDFPMIPDNSGINNDFLQTSY